MRVNIFLLLTTTIIWGFGFIAARWSFVVFDPVWSNALRFAIAGFLSLPLLFYKKSFWRKKNILMKSMISSIFLFGTLLFQNMGLNHTTIAKSGFITTLYSLFIPLTLMALTGKKYRPTFWALILMAMFGMALMCNLEIKDLNIGDFLTLLCAFCGALHIIYIEKVVNSIESPIEFNFLQSFFVAIFSISTAYIFKGPVNILLFKDFHSKAVLGVLYLGIVSSMISFSLQVIAQKKIPSHIVGLIFLTESPFAAFFGYVIFGELLNGLNILGASFIVLALVLIPVLGREVTTAAKVP